MKHRDKVIIPGGKTVDLLRTDVAATFRRIRREQERSARETAQKVTQIKKKSA
jgi:hypothetical protein